MRNLRLTLIPLGLAVWMATSLTAAPKIDLQRVTPVPADQPIPVADFFRPALLTGPTINRSGTHVAALITRAEDRYTVLVYDLATKSLDVAPVTGDRDVYSLSWMDDKHLLFHLSTEKLYAMALCTLEVGHARNWFPLIQYGGARVIRIPEQNPLQPLVWMRRDFETFRDEGVVVINTTANTGPLVDLLQATLRSSDFSDVQDRNNHHVLKSFPKVPGGVATWYACDAHDDLAFATTAKDGVLTLQRFDGTNWIKCPVDLDEIEIEGAGNEPGQLVVLGPWQPGKPRALQFMDAASGKLGDVILQDPEYDIDADIYRDHTTKRIIGVRYDRDGPRMVWFDEKFKSIQKALEGLFPRQVVQILDWDRAMTRFIVGHYSDRQPMAYEWVDLKAGTAGPIKQSRPWIDPARMRPMQILKFRTRDGKALDAYLTLPEGASKEHPVPLVVLSHGGPYVRDNWGYDGEVQFLASRGYAVLQTNYRGSTGYHWMFPRADKWDFVKMHEDVTSATKAVLGTKLIDRNRIAIMGGSFGGYLAIFGAVDEPSLYKCVVTIDGVYDWTAVTKDERYSQFDSGEYGWLVRRLGDPATNKERYDAISPLRRADRIQVPVFIAHGKDDDVVEIGQARNLISVLERNHVPLEKMLVSREGHGMGHIENQVDLYTRIEAFLARNIGPSAAAPAPVAAK